MIASFFVVKKKNFPGLFLPGFADEYNDHNEQYMIL